MTDRIALVLALVIVAALVADQALNGGAALLYLFGKFTQLVDNLIFWR